MSNTVSGEADQVAAIDKMSRSEYLSAVDLEVDLQEVLDVGMPAAATLGATLLNGVERILLVGSGGSGAALLAAQYLLDGLDPRPVQVVTGKDLGWRRPASLGPQTLVVLASYSGRTTDILETLDQVREAGSPTLALTGRHVNELVPRCDAALTYPGAAIFEAPILLLLALIGGSSPRDAPIAAVIEAARHLPSAVGRALSDAPVAMRRQAHRLSDADHIYVTGSGPLASLAFKLAPVLMENVRVGASYYDAAEMRHGPLEFLADRTAPLIALLGTDASRSVTAGVINFWTSHGGGDVVVLDAEAMAPIHPMLTPILVNPVSQWLVAWLAWERGIVDLDERVFMGKGLFSPGQWP